MCVFIRRMASRARQCLEILRMSQEKVLEGSKVSASHTANFSLVY